MSVPIVSGGELAAVLSLYAASSDAFSGDRASLVQIVAPHLAGALQAVAARSQSVVAPKLHEKPARELRLVAAR